MVYVALQVLLCPNAQGEITLKYVGGNTLTLFVRKDIDNTLKEIGKVHTSSKNIKVKLISPKMKFDVTLLPHQKQGKYWRGTYKVKSGDTLSKIAKEGRVKLEVRHKPPN
ncbi:LysM peptidoglycan-binding domain-containing protein [Acinetobacter baumannii]